MPERDKNGLEQAASTAHTVHSAIKTGQAISQTAKGMAVGGPYGAAAGLALAAGKHGKGLLAGALVILMLPVLFVLMLPGLIFGGLTSSGAPGQPVLNSSAAITGNMDAIAAAIDEILAEGIADAEARAAQDFAGTGGDNYEIVQPFTVSSNTNSFIGQYCAAKEQSWAEISLDDMRRILRSGKSSLYSFTRTSETRTVEADDQKKLASNYANNLSLFLGDGMNQYTEYSGGTVASLGDVRFTDGATEVVYYNQLDQRYANKPYGTDNIGGYGCSPTSMAIVVSSLTDDIVDPVEMAKWAYEHGGWCKGQGSYHSFIPNAAKAWGLPVEGCKANEPQRILDALSNGKLVVAIMSPGHFTTGGHFIVLRGVKDGQILVADPASTKRSQKEWDLSIILNEASKRPGAGGPFWIIG